MACVFGLQQGTVTGDEPITLAEAKLHCRIDGDLTADDALIQSLIVAARVHCERLTFRALVRGAWTLTLDGFEDWEIKLPRPPLAAVTSVQYRDQNNALQTLSSSLYQVDTNTEPGRITPAPWYVWPFTLNWGIATVSIAYTAGYAEPKDVPLPVKQAMLMLVAHWYDQREAVAGGPPLAAVPAAVDALLAPFVAWNYG